MKRSELIFVAVKPPLDYLALIFAAIAAYFIRFLPIVQNVRPVIFNLPFKDYFSLTLVIGLCWVAIFGLAGLYTIGGTKKLREELGRVFVACSAGLALVLAVMVFSRFLFDSRFIIIAVWVLAIIFVSLERLIIRTSKKFSYKFGFGVHRLAIIGNGQVAKELIREFTDHKSLGYRVVAQFSDFSSPIAEKIKAMAETDSVDEIIEVNPNANTEQTIDLINLANEYHLDFKYTADLLGTQLTNLEVVTYAGMPVVEVKKTRLDGWGRIYKRTFDLVGAIILIILTSPVMLLAALAIKLDSAGSVFFLYQRAGQFGKPFSYFKFRSMIKNAHQYRFDPEFLAQQKNLRDGSPMMKFKNDPRITRIGKIIRRFSIDELPELFIVLIGKMSLVGPRPHELEEVTKYQRHHKKVLTIRPGITGLAQVSGRSDLDFEEEIKLDTYYIENWSLALDLQIIFKTPGAIIKRRQTE
ncbi:MAG: sugar transferase [Patescibacteria group bacterium]|jgi:exopolysaccharide biosynthesis polyprenyl glycosylphosphotransferase